MLEFCETKTRYFVRPTFGFTNTRPAEIGVENNRGFQLPLPKRTKSASVAVEMSD